MVKVSNQKSDGTTCNILGIYHILLGIYLALSCLILWKEHIKAFQINYITWHKMSLSNHLIIFLPENLFIVAIYFRPLNMTMIWLNMIMQDQILSLAEYGVFSFYRPSY